MHAASTAHTAVSLPAGNTYQFRYLVDGKEWRNDEDADGTAQTPYFSENSVLDLSNTDGR